MNARVFLIAGVVFLASLGLLLDPLADNAASNGAFAATTSSPASAPTTARAGNSFSFASDVMPLFDKYGCNAAGCHAAQAGKNGFKLSLFGEFPDSDYMFITSAMAGRRINKIEPSQSLILLKPTASVSHKGGKKFQVGSADYNMLLAWISRGAPWGWDKLPRLVSIQVSPDKLILQKGQSGALSVMATYADGTQKDITKAARYQSSDLNVASAVEGKVTAKDVGPAAMVVMYLHRSAVARIAVPQSPAGGFPQTASNNKIDDLVFAKLKELGIPPSELCSDQEFLRRVHLDVIGILPTPDEARAFLADSDPQKRSKLIDRLLERNEYADYWSLKWGDLLRIKSEFPINLWPNAVQAYYHWVRDSIAKNKPYDQFARELVTASGSDFRDPASNYYRAVSKRDAQGYSEATALVFMGMRMECARCHVHPTDEWTTDDNLGMAAFFGKVQVKPTLEWKEEIVFVNPDQVFRNPATKQPVEPKLLGGDVLTLSKEEDPRVKFADWLVSPQNPWFARNIVNRAWYWLMGRGIIHEPDDIRSTNPPSNPELLAFLESELVGHKYDLKHIFRLILNSRTYQLSSRTNEWNAKDATCFSHYAVRRLGAEQLLDAIGQVTETSEPFSSKIPEPYTVLPEGFRSTQLFDGSIGTAFLDMFGRPPRDTPYEADRNLQLSMRQILYMINSAFLEGKITKSPRLTRLLQGNKTDAEIVEEIYLAAFSRLPGEEEKQKVLDYIGKDKKNRAQAVRDVVWAILNTKEFLFNH